MESASRSKVFISYYFDQRGGELFAGIGAVGEKVHEPGEAVADRREDIRGAVAILNIGGMDDGPD